MAYLILSSQNNAPEIALWALDKITSTVRHDVIITCMDNGHLRQALIDALSHLNWASRNSVMILVMQKKRLQENSSCITLPLPQSAVGTLIIIACSWSPLNLTVYLSSLISHEVLMSFCFGADFT
jgi:hypothetical protein